MKIEAKDLQRRMRIFGKAARYMKAVCKNTASGVNIHVITSDINCAL